MGERYGDFELLRLIATGGMAEIYLAKHDSFGGFTRNVVVKKMLPQLAVRNDFVQMFLDEARLAANFNHPNIVQVFNLGEVPSATGKSYYIAMEFVDGPHLGTLFAHSLRMRKPLPIELCAYVVARAADGLHYAHEQNDPATGEPLSIVHRDISPQNILVSRQGDVKVTDFGVAKASTQQTKTRTGIIKGKVAYMSPEQCLGEVVDRRTDVFALGIVLYELLTRRRLFRDKSDLLIMQKITGEDVQPASSVNRDLDSELDAICTRALARTRDARFSDAGELGEALDAWLATHASDRGDPRAQLQRWFDQNAMELSLGAESDTGSLPSFSATAQVRPASPGEATAATPSLNSAETVMRPGETTSSRPAPGVTEPSGAPIRPAMRAEETLPQRGGTDNADELTQRAVRPGMQTLSESQSESDLESEMTVQSPTAPVAPVQGGGVSSPTMASPRAETSGSDFARPIAEVWKSVDAQPKRSMPIAAIAAGVVVALVIGVVVVAKSGDKKGEEGGETPPVAVVPAVPPTPPPTPPSDDKNGKLVIESVPPVEILLDGKSAGKAPVTVEHPAGHMRVQAVFDDQPPGALEVDLGAGEVKTLHIVAKVPLIVKSTPPGAKVKIDGIADGFTPLERAGRVIPDQEVKIRLELAGYMPLDETITPKAGEPAALDLKLEKIGDTIRTPPPRPAVPLRNGTLKMRSSPWVNVKVQGTSVKFSTPGAVSVPGGKQTLLLSNPEAKLTDTLTLVIPEDKEVRVDLTYEQQPNGKWVLKTHNIR